VSLALVQSFGGYNHSTVASVASSAANCTAGNLLIATARWTETPYTATIADTAGNTWATDGPYTDANSGHRLQMWYAYNITGNASNVVTITFSTNSSNSGVSVMEFSGERTSSDPLDAHGYNVSTSGNQPSVTSGTFSTASANEVIVAGSATNNFGEAYTADTGYTIPSGATQDYVTSQYKIVSSTQSSVTATMNWSPNISGTIGVLTFVAAAAASSIVPIIMHQRRMRAT
jgi:hypothetical protein